MSLALRTGTTGRGGMESTVPPVQAAMSGEDPEDSDTQGLLHTQHCPGGDGKFTQALGLVSLLPPAGI